MPSMPENSSSDNRHLYEYAVVRFVPDVERGEFVNIGLVMMCKRRRWLKCAFHFDVSRIAALFPEADCEVLRAQAASFLAVAAGDGSPIGSLEAHERFRWLTAVRSASLATSRPHPGHASDLDATFAALFARLVL